MKTSKARMHRADPHTHSHRKPSTHKPHREPEVPGEDKFLPESPRQTGIRSGREKKAPEFYEIQ